MGRSVEKPRTVEDVIDRGNKPWQLSEILDPVQCRSVTMPESTDSSSKVRCLLFIRDCHYSMANCALYTVLII